MENEKENMTLEQNSETPAEGAQPSVAEEAALNDATVVVAAADTGLGSGVGEAVIDRDEWNKIVAEVDAQQSETAKKEAEVEDKKGKKKKKKHGFFFWFFMFILVAGLAVCGFVGFKVKSILDDTPKINPENLYDYLTENSEILDKDGNTLTYVYDGSMLRTNIEYQDLPKNMINALLDTEDKTFFEHHGFNYVRIMGAIWDFVKSGFKTKISGTSTITQQLARNIYLPETAREHSYVRKIQEAYYTVIIEKTLSKEQILEAYMNTIFLGSNAEGVQAAAQAYFSKDIQDLDLIECAVLAALPQLPGTYTPLKREFTANIDDFSQYDVITKNDTYTIYYNDKIEDRVWLILHNMVAQGHLSQEEFDQMEPNIHDLIRASLNPSMTIDNSEVVTSYFTDYVVNQVIKDFQVQLGYTEEEAHDLVYKGGLTIHSTLDLAIQNHVEKYFDDYATFPDAANNDSWRWIDTTSYDSYGNILSQANWDVMFFWKGNMFSEVTDEETGEVKYVFTLTPSDYTWLEDGSMMIYANRRLNFYRTQVGDEIEYSMEFKPYYCRKSDGKLYVSTGGHILIDKKYKTRDDSGNMILSADFFTDKDSEGNLLYENRMTIQDDGNIVINPDVCTLSDEIIQPQGAFVIIESATGQIRCMVGGRKTSGGKLYNRAINPRQTGSSIKPLSVYSTALQKGFTNAKLNAEDGGHRTVYTTATVIDDAPTSYGGVLWPYNSEADPRYGDGRCIYNGHCRLRYAVQQSLNCVAVSVFDNYLSAEEVIDQLQKYGVTSLKLDGEYNDVNNGALALGGLVNGISPLEMCAAYASIGNYGVYNSPSAYTTVTNGNGDVVLTAPVESRRVLDTEVASLTLNVLRSVVKPRGDEPYGGGMGWYAQLSSQEVAGKTGTTSDNYDLWFCGLTPKYSATFWTGCDYNLYVDGYSGGDTTVIWSRIMEGIGEMDPYEQFEMRGDAGFVYRTIDTKTGLLPTEKTPSGDMMTEVFIAGTEPTTSDPNARRTIEICAETGYLATPECKEKGCTIMVDRIQRPRGQSWEKTLIEMNLYALSDEQKGALIYRLYDSDQDIPDYYCHKHNKDTSKYPVSPIAKYAKYDTDKYKKQLDEETLKKAQEEKTKALNDAFDAIDQSGLDATRQAALKKAKDDGLAAIKAAKTKEDVDAALNSAIAAMNAIVNPEPEPQPDPDPQPDPEPQPDPQPDPEPQPDPQPNPEPQPDPESNPDNGGNSGGEGGN